MKVTIWIFLFLFMALNVNADQMVATYNDDGEVKVHAIGNTGIEGVLKHVGNNYDIIDSSELPSREFREAWRGKKGDKIIIKKSAKDAIVKERNIKNKIAELTRKQAEEALGYV